MRLRLPLFVGALLLASLAMAGAATAVPVDGESPPVESIPPENDSSDAGICVVGAGGPCNADDGSDRDYQQPVEDREIGSDGGNDSDDVGICLVGAGGPCNADDGSNRSDRQPVEDKEIDSGDSNESDVGICLVGAGGPCNSDDGSNRSDRQPVEDKEIGSDGDNDSTDAGICLVGAGGPCNGDQPQYYGDDSTTDSTPLLPMDPLGLLRALFAPLT